MAEENPQSSQSGGQEVASDDAAKSSAPTTQKLEGPAQEPPSKTTDPVEALRAAHGLSPKAKTKEEVAEARRREKEEVAEERRRKAKQQHRSKVIRRTILVVLLVLVIGIIVGFWVLRWGLHDDVSSIQGKWRVQGTDTVIEITDEDIVLTDEVAYDYVLDPESKTLVFTFGGLTGNGRYRFSLDHSMLAIDDGEFDFWETLAQDVPWTFEAVSQELIGAPETSPSLGSGEMVLERIE